MVEYWIACPSNLEQVDNLLYAH